MPQLAKHVNFCQVCSRSKIIKGHGIYLDPTASGEPVVVLFPPESAKEVGFEKGDVLTAVNGQAVPKGSRLQVLWEGSMWDGSDVTLTMWGSDGAKREVALTSRPQSFWNLEAQQAIRVIGEQALDRNLTFGIGLVRLWFVVTTGSPGEGVITLGSWL